MVVKTRLGLPGAPPRGSIVVPFCKYGPPKGTTMEPMGNYLLCFGALPLQQALAIC